MIGIPPGIALVHDARIMGPAESHCLLAHPDVFGVITSPTVGRECGSGTEGDHDQGGRSRRR